MTQAESQNPTSTRPMQGYPAIEGLVASGDFREINTSFKEMHDKLEHMMKESRGFGKAVGAKKAIRSLELTVDLLRHLLQIKATMAQQKNQSRSAEASAHKKV